MKLTEEQRNQIDSALSMLLCALRAANWEGDAAYTAGEKACELLAAHNAGAQGEPFISPTVIDRSHKNQAYVTYGFVSEEACTQFIKATRNGSGYVYAHPQPIADAARDVLGDSKMIDWLRDETCDLRCINVPTGGDDCDVRWAVIQHHMAEPHEHEIGRSFTDEPREAIRDAIKRLDRAKGE